MSDLGSAASDADHAASGDTEETVIDRLRGPGGAQERQRMLDALEELRLRLQAALRSGAPREDFESLQAAWRAVEACRDALARIQLPP